MKLKDILSRIPHYYNLSMQPGGPAIRLRGPIGIGKSSTLSKAPTVLAQFNPGKKFGLVIINGTCVTLTTATGYLWPETVGEKTYSRFTRPDWWRTMMEDLPLEDYDGGIIVVDEDDKLNPDEKKIFGEAALSKRLASHQLPPGWCVWFAGNRASDKSGSTKELSHLNNRVLTINVDHDAAGLIEWFEEQGGLPETMSFVRENEAIVFPDRVPDDFSPFCTSRSLAAWDMHLRLLIESGIPHSEVLTGLTLEEGNGLIGMSATAQYVATWRLSSQLPAYEAIIADPTGTPIPTRIDAQMMAIYKIANNVTKADAGAAMTYVQRMSDEFSINFVRRLMKRDKKLINVKEISDWALKNASLVALVGKLKESSLV
jgi:hypothetical protein